MSELQPFLVKGHKKKECALLYWRFPYLEVRECRVFVHELLSQYVFTSQRTDAEPVVFLGITEDGFTCLGIQSPLNYTDEQLSYLSVKLYDDGSRDEGNLHTLNRESHIILQIAADNLEVVDSCIAKIKSRLRQIGVKKIDVRVEYGKRKGPGTGAFGYREGIFNPKNKRDIESVIVCNPSFTFEDRQEIKFDDIGTFGAVMKFRTYTEAFKQLIKKFTDHNEGASFTEKRARALIMGRYTDGSPAMNQKMGVPTKDWIHSHSKFEEDSEGRKCPLGAHVRVTHSKDDEPKILRRGMLINEERAATKGEAGLFFISYQKNLSAQLFPLVKQIIERKDLIVYPSPADETGYRNANFYDEPDSNKPLNVDKRFFTFTKFMGEQYLYYPGKAFFNNLQKWK